jgi:phosphoadenosine phosphosulfate reductase
MQELLRESIKAIQQYAPIDGSPYYGLFSGGKDSIALKAVTEMAGVPVRWHYNVTTIDPPELVYFIRNNHADVQWVRPKHGPFFVRAAEVKGFPTRRVRWCCEEYKESRSPAGVTMLMGIRAEESPKRAKTWGLVTTHKRTKGLVVNPLLYWDSETLWNFIHEYRIKYCNLYDEGFHRLGCVGCPMARRAGREKEFARWPRYERAWKKVFRRVWERRSGSIQRNGRPWFGDVYFHDWEGMWNWWMSDKSLPKRLFTDEMLLFFNKLSG